MSPQAPILPPLNNTLPAASPDLAPENAPCPRQRGNSAPTSPTASPNPTQQVKPAQNFDLASLARPQARLCLQVARFISKRCQIPLQGEKLLLAVSGGADSLALLLILAALRTHLGHDIAVVHIDHGLRPESSAEAHFVATFCAARHIQCTVRVAPVAAYTAKHKLGLEEASRHLRYQICEEERQGRRAAWILTGHHRDDLAEDILMRLTRGTGWPGLGGMVAVDRQRHLLRPLLLCDPAALRTLLQSLNLSWQEDPSNNDIHLCRNRMRHILVPLLRVENPSLHQGVENLWNLAREDEEHWENVVQKALRSHKVSLAPPCITLPKALLQCHDRATRLRLYLKAVHSLGQGQARAHTLFQLDEAWSQGRGNTHFQLPGKISVRLVRGQVSFSISSPFPEPSATVLL